jgi:hypothetical protein
MLLRLYNPIIWRYDYAALDGVLSSFRVFSGNPRIILSHCRCAL